MVIVPHMNEVAVRTAEQWNFGSVIGLIVLLVAGGYLAYRIFMKATRT